MKNVIAIANQGTAVEKRLANAAKRVVAVEDCNPKPVFSRD